MTVNEGGLTDLIVLRRSPGCLKSEYAFHRNCHLFLPTCISSIFSYVVNHGHIYMNMSCLKLDTRVDPPWHEISHRSTSKFFEFNLSGLMGWGIDELAELGVCRLISTCKRSQCCTVARGKVSFSCPRYFFSRFCYGSVNLLIWLCRRLTCYKNTLKQTLSQQGKFNSRLYKVGNVLPIALPWWNYVVSKNVTLLCSLSLQPRIIPYTGCNSTPKWTLSSG